MSLDINALRELLDSINQTDITELTLKSEDFELTVRRGSQASGPVYALPPALPDAATTAIAAEVARGTEAPAVAVVPAAAPGKERRLLDVTSPMVGTFYRSPAPDEPPFVDVGDRIHLGQAICIIEAMKLMNELEAEVAGEIVEVLVENGQPVEYGQILMRVNPS